MSTNPFPLMPGEWDEVASVDFVRELWGLESGDAGQEFSKFAYGARFDFVSGGPGYVGDLYIISDDALGGPPVVLTRDTDQPAGRQLQRVDFNR